MLKNLQYKSWILVLFFSVLFVIITAITDDKHNKRVCNTILISIDLEDGNYFLDKETITSLMTEKGKYNLIGEKYKNIDTKLLENRIKSNIFVEMKVLVLVACILALSAPVLSSRKQSYRVKGKLLCGSAPATNIRVKLVDVDGKFVYNNLKDC